MEVGEGGKAETRMGDGEKNWYTIPGYISQWMMKALPCDTSDTLGKITN